MTTRNLAAITDCARAIASACVCVAALLTLGACGGSDGGGPPPEPGETVSGTVIAGGHIQNAVVFLDLNDNNVLDSNERRTVTDANGRFTLTGINAADVGKHALVARISPAATNGATGRPAGLDATLKAPAGGGTLISPYSTLVAGVVAAGSPAPTVAAATTQVLAKVRASTLPFTLPTQLDLARDYVADSGAATPTAADSRQLRLLAASLAGILSTLTSGLNQRQSVFDASRGYPFDLLVALTENQLTHVANGTLAFSQLDAVQRAALYNNPGGQPTFFVDGNAMLSAFIANIRLSSLLPDVKDFIVNSPEFQQFFASLMLDLIQTVVELLFELLL